MAGAGFFKPIATQVKTSLSRTTQTPSKTCKLFDEDFATKLKFVRDHTETRIVFNDIDFATKLKFVRDHTETRIVFNDIFPS